ncbi:hypothetical protein JCM11641_003610 [Rhodosporidiobolus odoratus]
MPTSSSSLFSLSVDAEPPTLASMQPSPRLDLPDSLRQLAVNKMQSLLQQQSHHLQQQDPWPQWPPSDDLPRPGEGTLPSGNGRNGGGTTEDQTLALLIPLLLLLTLLLFLTLLLTLLLLRRRLLRGSIHLLDGENEVGGSGGPINMADPQGMFRGAEGGFEGVEARWLEEQDEGTRRGYERGKAWQLSSPPASEPSEITLSQLLSIQEKGVSAWSFEPDYESASPVVVIQRTELTFLDGVSKEEPCSVLSNLPVPRLNEVYYWEVKMFELPVETGVSIGLATRPYPSFRLPGHSPHSLAYHSQDGFISASHPFLSRSYGPPLTEGDVLGVGYRPRTGTIFYTRNGRSLGDSFIGFNRHNVFPCIGSTGPASLQVNLGQAGFVYIEANVKKWGLAPMMGTLAPPPAYGSEGGSLLLESGRAVGEMSASSNPPGPAQTHPHSNSHHLATASSSSTSSSATRRFSPSPSSLCNTRSGGSGSITAETAAAAAAAALSSSIPIRPSPLRHGHSRQPSAASNTSSRTITPPHPHPEAQGLLREGQLGGGEEEDYDEDYDQSGPANPPTPGLLDISLHSLHRFPERVEDDEEELGDGQLTDEEAEEEEEEVVEEEDEEERERQATSEGDGVRNRVGRGAGGSPPPPDYNPIDPHMYAPGVAETILEDALSAFSLPSSSSSQPQSRSNRPGSSSSTSRLPALNPAQAALLQRFVAERAAARSPGSGVAGYERRTEDENVEGGGEGAGGGRGFWGWLAGSGRVGQSAV